MPQSHAFVAAGMTYRQLDHWTKQGYLVETGKRGTPGPGSARVWSQTELDVAKVMIRLVKAGIIPERAAEVGRVVATQGSGTYDLADGVSVSVRL